MNNWIKSIFGASGLAVVIALAANGKNLVAAVEAAFLFLLLLADKAPLGLWSFALAIALAVMAQAFVSRYANQLPCPRSRDFALGLLGLAIGIGVMYAQLRTVNGLLLGILAGFSSPFAYQALAAAWGWVLRPPVEPAPTPKEPLDE